MRARAVFVVAVLALAGTASAAAQSSSKAPPQLDYDYFTKRVEPIFLAKRAGHARCYVCHAESNNTLRLEKLEPGKLQTLIDLLEEIHSLKSDQSMALVEAVV